MKPAVFLLLGLVPVASLVSGCAKRALAVAAEAERPHAGDKPNAAADAICGEHNVPLAQCGICRPQLASTLEPGQSAKVRLASADSAALAGVTTVAAQSSPIADVIDCHAEVVFDQNRFAHIASPVAGTLQQITVDAGAHVAEQQSIARIWSATISEAVAKAVLTHQNLERERTLRKEQVNSEKDLHQAEAEHRAACEYARTLGFTEQDIDHFRGRPDAPVFLDLRSPLGGEIVERSGVQGERVEPGRVLFTVADRSTMWAILAIPEQALARVRVGQTVELMAGTLPDRGLKGRLTWISAEVDDRTRMVRARAEIPNPDGALRARMFVRARIYLREPTAALVLPSRALQRIEGRDFLFVKREEDLFEARVVTVGARQDGMIEVTAGIAPDEIVAVDHVFALKSAFLISRLGAGCADD